jgi:hypothetical protein
LNGPIRSKRRKKIEFTLWKRKYFIKKENLKFKKVFFKTQRSKNKFNSRLKKIIAQFLLKEIKITEKK